ncbi:hypothetical protein JL101_036260 (plasmid) [Skermanella rosea]|uniref:hypothetical protein n=1 Tax=Skermanella rosea TaxID=1817965 RepID=UPI0019348C8B|nr:hypothetical protein [Skermanella rosea]UEM08150.1 hypothetical protein JL101_036260 [Skermanella rosea]
MEPTTNRRPNGRAGSGHARVDQPPDSVTVLRTFGPLATKRIRFNKPTGSYKFENYGRAAKFSIAEHPVADIHDLAQLLEATAQDPQSFVVRGKPAEGIDRQCAQRRLYPRKNKATGEIEPATLEPADRHWLLLDVDGIPCPDTIDPIHEPEAVVEHVVSLLPPEFDGVTCWWAFTSGHGIKPGIRLRLGFWSSRKLGTEQLKAWLGEMVTAEDGSTVKRWPVDCSIFVPTQPNYIAKPIFEGAYDPVPHRSGLWVGHSNEFDPPQINLSKPVIARSAAPQMAGLGYDSYRTLIGDHSGMGFYEPIKKAVAAYIRRHGSAADTTWLRADLEAVIRDRGHTRDHQYVEDRVRDLDGLIERIRGFQAADEARQKEVAPFALPRGAIADVEPYWVTDPRSVSDVRKSLNDVIREKGHIAVKLTPGTGKSTAEGELAMQAEEGWTLHMYPNHEVAAAFVTEIQAKGGVAFHLTGRGYEDAKGLMCVENTLAELAHKARLNVREEVCAYCPKAFGCRYLGLLMDVESALATAPTGVLVAVHNYFSQSMAREVDSSKFHRVVVDERIDIGFDLPVPLDRLEEEMADAITARRIKEAFNSEGWLDLTGFDADDLEERAEVEGRSAKLVMNPEWSWPQRIEAIRQHAERRGADLRWKFQKLLETMAWEIRQGRKFSNQIVLTHAEKQRDGTHRAVTHVFGKKEIAAKLAGLDVHYLDGTMDELQARALLGAQARYFALDAERNLHVTQVTDAKFSKNHLLHRPEAEQNRHKVYQFLEALSRNHRRILVGLPKECRDVMEDEWLTLVDTMDRPPIVRFMHFNKSRSSNRFKSFDAVVVVGREEPAVRAVEAVARKLFPDQPIIPIASTEKDGEFGPQWPSRAQGYTMRDGRRVGVEVNYHPCPLCQSVLQQIREGEIVQLVDRLRPVNRADQPAAYLLTNIPTELVVDRLVAWRDLVAETCELTWWQKALTAGHGVAPLTPGWLVGAGIFANAEAAKKAVARLLEKTGHQPLKNNSYMAGVPFFKTTPYRRQGQRGHASMALVAPGVANPADLLARHVGPLKLFDGLEVLDPKVQTAAVIEIDPAAFEPDEPALAELAAAGQPVKLDTEAGVTALRERLTWIEAINAATGGRLPGAFWSSFADDVTATNVQRRKLEEYDKVIRTKNLHYQESSL